MGLSAICFSHKYLLIRAVSGKSEKNSACSPLRTDLLLEGLGYASKQRHL